MTELLIKITIFSKLFYMYTKSKDKVEGEKNYFNNSLIFWANSLASESALSKILNIPSGATLTEASNNI